MMPSRLRATSPDPFTVALQPPPDETPEERAFREGMWIQLQYYIRLILCLLLAEAKEQEALRISNAIDESLRAERAAERRKKVTRLLLLGQSESGIYN